MSHPGTAAHGGQPRSGGGHGAEAVPHDPVFVGRTRGELEALFARYPTKQACLLPALWMVQEARG
ncbi:MAG: hypothetical protein ACREMX_12835, partial [Gemmatimonadales bacterium]